MAQWLTSKHFRSFRPTILHTKTLD